MDSRPFQGGSNALDPLEDPLQADLPLPELDLGAVAQRPTGPAGRPPPGRSGSASGRPEPSRGVEPQADREGGTAARAGKSRAPTVEIARIAGFGSVPRGLLGSVFYTIQVFSRRRELRSQLRDARRVAEAAEFALDQALIATGRALFERSDQLDAQLLGGALTAVREAQQQARDREDERERWRGGMENELRDLEAQIQGIKADLDTWRDRETKLATQLRAREADLERARARLKRAEIEVRNAASLAPPAPPGPPPPPGSPPRPPGQANRQKLFEAERDARQAEVRMASESASTLEAQLTEVRQQLTQRMATLAQAADRRRQIEAATRTTGQLQHQRLEVATEELQQGYRDLAVAARAHGQDQAVDEDLRARVETAFRLRSDRADAVNLVEQAQDSYDKPTIRRGLTVLGVVGGIIVTMFVLAAVI